MNVTCEKCQRRYAVPDDKLREGKLRIRCRNCQHPIEVSLPPTPPTAQAGPAANPWDEEPTRAAPRLDKNAQWFALRDGQQEGPLELSALQERVRAGEITLATLLWRDGLPEWQRADQLPELLPVFAAPRSAKPKAVAEPPVAPPAKPEPAPRPALQGLFDDEERTVLRPNVRPSRSKPAVQPARVEAAPPPEEEELPEPSRGGKAKWLLLALLALVLAGGAAVLLRSPDPVDGGAAAKVAP